MPMTVYGTETHKVELRMKNIFVKIRDGVSVNELIRACNYDRILIENVHIDGFNGECLIKSQSVGDVDIRGVVCALPEDRYVSQTDEGFVIKSI
jgi:hypothetical protein